MPTISRTTRVGVLVVALLTALLTADGTGATGAPGVPGITCEPGIARDCASPGTIRWWVALDGQQPQSVEGSSTAAIEGGNLVFYVECDVVRAIERRTGRMRWKDTGIGSAGCFSDRRLAYGDGLLVETERWAAIGQTPARTIVLDAATGVRLSTYDLVDDPVAVAAGAVVFATGRQAVFDGLTWRLTAFDARTGRVRWSIANRRAGEEPVLCSSSAFVSPPPIPCPDAGVLYLADLLPGLDPSPASPPDRSRAPAPRGPLIHRIDLRRGVALPDVPMDPELGKSVRLAAYAPPSGVLVLLDGTVYRAIDRDTGRQLWSTSAPRSGAGVLGVDYEQAGDELVYLSGPQAIEAREARTGLLRWEPAPALRKRSDLFEAALGSQVVGAMDDAGGQRYVGLDAQTGALRWSAPMGIDLGITSFGGVTLFRLAAAQPPLLLGVVCSPPIARHGEPCVSRRLVAVNW